MAPENTQPGSEQSEGAEQTSQTPDQSPEQPAPRKRAPRRATKKAAAPEPASDVAPADSAPAMAAEPALETASAPASEPAAGGDAPDSAEAAAGAPAAAPKRTRKTAAKKATAKKAPAKRTRKATAPATTVEAPAEADSPVDAPADAEPAPATTVDTAAVIVSERDDSTATEAPAEAPAEPVAPVKRARRARKAATRPASAPAPAEVLTEAAHAATDDDDEAVSLADAISLASGDDDAPGAVTVITADEVLATLEPEALAAAQSADEDDAEPVDIETLTVPSFGLLFQAPDPSRARRSRRASAPAQTPVHHEPEDADATVESDDEQDEQQSEDRGRRRGERARGRRRGRADRDARDEQDETRSGDDARDDSDDSDADAESRDARDSGQDDEETPRRRRSRGGRGRRRRDDDADERSTSSDESSDEDSARGTADDTDESDDSGDASSSRRRRRRRRAGSGAEADDAPGVVTKVREPRRSSEATGIRGSTRLEAKKQRRREGREAGRRRTIITEAEFLARREAVKRSMIVRVKDSRTQIAVLEDGVLVEHYVSQETSQSSTSIAGNVFLGRVQNVLPSMEAAFVDIGRGRNAVLYAGEVNWDAAGLESGQPRRIENALKPGDTVVVQATKDPIGHKGARLTSQVSLPGRYLVYVPNGNMTGISRKLPDTERARLKKILREVVPDKAGVIVRTAAEGASEAELKADVARLTTMWDDIQARAQARSTHAPALLHGEPDLTVRVVRDVFNEDFSSLVVSGEEAWRSIKPYIDSVVPDLADRVSEWDGDDDVFAKYRVDEQLAKAMDRKVHLPSGGSLVIDRTEAMTVVDVNTGKFTGHGGNLEETVTKNNLEAAEEVVRQLRLRDIGGIIVVDFIDMVLEANRDLVLRRLVECLGRDRTKHQVAEVTSLGLVQMTRKRVGTGLIESFSEVCTCCNGRGLIIHDTPVGDGHIEEAPERGSRKSRGRGRGDSRPQGAEASDETPASNGPTPAQIAAAAHAAAQAAATKVDESDDDAPASDAEVAAAIEDAVTSALGEAVAPEVDQQQEPERESGRRGRRGRGSRRAERAETQTTDAVVPSAPVEPEPVVAPSEPAQPEPETVSQPEAPRRRARKRVTSAVTAPTSRPVELLVEKPVDAPPLTTAAGVVSALAADAADAADTVDAADTPAEAPTAEPQPDAVPRRRARKRVTSAVAAPTSRPVELLVEKPVEAPTLTTVAADVPAEAAADAADDDAQPEQARPARRTRRSRVVAPAGPPSAAGETPASDA